MKTTTVLIVEDNRNLATLLADYLEAKVDFQTTVAPTGEAGLTKIESGIFDIVLLDFKLPDMDALEFLHEMTAKGWKLPVIILTAHGSIERAVECMQKGASDFITKPCPPVQVAQHLKNALEAQRLGKELRSYRQIRTWEEAPFIGGNDETIKKLLQIAEKVAKTDSAILISGESGTGKEILARTIVRKSLRADKPFVKVDCTGLTEELLASDLFGHTRGAFTGATKTKMGRVEVADGGTLFLDEISEMPLNLQAKLMRVIEQHEYERVGDNKTRKVDLRIIAATNADLNERIQNGLFRPDLFYRLNVVHLEIPPLRARIKDIPLLVKFFLHSIEKRTGVPYCPTELSENILNYYSWPGNVREMRNLLERATIFCNEGVITPDCFPDDLIRDWSEPSPLTLRTYLQQQKIKFVKTVLAEENGDTRRAASRLGIHPRYIYQILKNSHQFDSKTQPD